MFDNIGGKIKVLAQVVCWIGIICSALFGIIIVANGKNFVFLGFMIMFVGSLLSWCSSFVLYGFGELIENSEIANSNTYEIHKLLTRIAPEGVSSTPISTTTSTIERTPDGGWICKKCGTKNVSNTQFCKDCGTYK